MIAPASDLPRESLSIAPLMRTGLSCADTKSALIQIPRNRTAKSGAAARGQERRMDDNPFKISVLEKKLYPGGRRRIVASYRWLTLHAPQVYYLSPLLRLYGNLGLGGARIKALAGTGLSPFRDKSLCDEALKVGTQLFTVRLGSSPDPARHGRVPRRLKIPRAASGDDGP